MRPLVLLAARGLLVLGPVALAFKAGGYFDGPRLLALGVAALALALVAAGERRPLPGTRAGRLALGAFAALTAWVVLSSRWAPAGDVAGDDGERVLLYAVALLAAAGAWRSRSAAARVEPLAAAGALVVVGYGLAGRLLPGLVALQETPAAGGRLSQPLTYWNAMGALAALGAVLCVRMAGDRGRAPAWRATAAAAAVPLLLGLYLSFSRGALVALVAGLLVLLLTVPTWSQLRAAAVTLEAAVVAVAASDLSPGVRALAGSHRTREGAVVLALLLVAMAAAAGLTLWGAREESRERTHTGRLPLPRWAAPATVALIALLVVVPVVAAGEGGGAGPEFGAASARFGSVDSNRYAYWRVAVDAWAEHPLVGTGTGGFEAAWLRHRPFAEGARDAHSLELETLAELGLVGALLLSLAVAGVVACARRLQREDPALAAGPIAALAVWAVHASLDWDWELPALTLVALGLAGLLVAQAGAPRRAASASSSTSAPAAASRTSPGSKRWRSRGTP